MFFGSAPACAIPGFRNDRSRDSQWGHGANRSRRAHGSLPSRGVRLAQRIIAGYIGGYLIMAGFGATHAFAQSSPQASAQSSATAPADGVYDLIVGTYTSGKSEGLYVYRFDTNTGHATPLSVAKTVNPSFLVVSRDRRFVYAVNELPGDNGPATQRGGVSAFSFDPASGRLTLLNHVSSEGNDPCYLSLSPDGRYLFAANYSVAADPGGSFAVFPVEPDGKLGQAVLTVHHEGRGPVKGRQDNAHVHSTVFSPDGQFLFAQDLGADKLYVYRYKPDASGAPVDPATRSFITVKSGSGPRHLLFGADGRHAYLTSELGGTLTVFDYEDGRLTPKQTEPLAAPGFKGTGAPAALHLSPDGRFLYASNRGDANDIVIFSVDAASGRLKRVGEQSSLGKTPREFAIDPTGRWLIVGNQNSDSAYVFRRDPQTGLLGPNPTRLDIGSPVDFSFVAP